MSRLLPCVEVDSGGTPGAAVIWLHGLGASGHDFEPIVPALGLPHVRFVFPHAPERAVTINSGWVMPAWYDIKTLTRGPERESETDIRESQELVEALIQREQERGIPPDRIVLAGFSQGAAMALHVGLRYPETLAGLMILSGYFVLEETLEHEMVEANAATPIFFGHGRRDGVVPCASGRRAWEQLDTEGRPTVWRDYLMGHEVCPEEIRDVAGWLGERLA